MLDCCDGALEDPRAFCGVRCQNCRSGALRNKRAQIRIGRDHVQRICVDYERNGALQRAVQYLPRIRTLS